jgi:hypothetical protein
LELTLAQLLDTDLGLVRELVMTVEMFDSIKRVNTMLLAAPMD